MELTVIFPAYNEEENIRGAMARALEALRPRFGGFEILIVDDASRDATGRIADELAAEHPEIRVVHHASNQGAGAGIITGFQHARGDLVIHNAMDYPFDLCDLDKLLPAIKNADVVVAARKERAGYTPYRTLVSIVNRRLLRLLFPLRLKDYNFTQLYRRSVLDAVPIASRSTAFLTPSLLIGAYDLGFRIVQVDIDYYPRVAGVASSGKVSVIFTSVRDMLSFWLKRNWNRLGSGKRQQRANVGAD